jgi:hypothetical protein
MASRITRKSAAPKLKRFQITAEALPGAIFFSLPSARPNRRRSSPVLIYNSAKASRLKGRAMFVHTSKLGLEGVVSKARQCVRERPWE